MGVTIGGGIAGYLVGSAIAGGTAIVAGEGTATTAMITAGATAAAGVVVVIVSIGGVCYFKYHSSWTYENAREEVFLTLRDKYLIEKHQFV